VIIAGVDKTQVEESLKLYRGLNGSTGITFGMITQQDQLVISNMLSGFNLCGNTELTNEPMPMVCTTTVNNHKSALIEVKFMTDGTTASIAPETIKL
jgi:hypothetical protein